MINSYIDKIASITKYGDAREESYYSALSWLLEDYSVGKRNKRFKSPSFQKRRRPETLTSAFGVVGIPKSDTSRPNLRGLISTISSPANS
jgi:hypothetical protein